MSYKLRKKTHAGRVHQIMGPPGLPAEMQKASSAPQGPRLGGVTLPPVKTPSEYLSHSPNSARGEGLYIKAELKRTCNMKPYWKRMILNKSTAKCPPKNKETVSFA